MAGFWGGFALGFLDSTNEGIEKRKNAAQEYLDKSMATALKYSQSSRGQNKELEEQARQSLGKLRGAGVPDDVIKSISGQNPDELDNFYSQIADMQAKGVKMTPEIYRGLIKVSKEQGTNPTELIRNNKEPLANNMKADPEGFDLDSVGGIWSTLMGYNAMERANAKLENTQMGDKTAADWIRGGEEDTPTFDTGAVLDYEKAGDLVKEANAKDTSLKPDDLVELRKEHTKIADGIMEDWKSKAIKSGKADMIRNPELRKMAEDAATKQLETMGYSSEDINKAISSTDMPTESPEQPSDGDESSLLSPPSPIESRPVGERRKSPRDGKIRTWDGSKWI